MKIFGPGALFRVEPQSPEALIRGLALIPDFIDAEVEAALIAEIDRNIWDASMRRRVQHYGYRYDYRAREVAADAHLGPLPPWLAPIARRLVEQSLAPLPPDQAIVNEYAAGQGIAPHTDCIDCFGDGIASLSLSSHCAMKFETRGLTRPVEIILERRSLLVMRGPARYNWRHSIPARKSDVVGDRRVSRSRRISVTFRKILGRGRA